LLHSFYLGASALMLRLHLRHIPPTQTPIHHHGGRHDGDHI
jgi:hypothetical protein